FGGSLLGAKRLALLHELVPKISVVAVLLDPDTTFEIEVVETAARALGLQIVPVKLASERDLDAASIASWPRAPKRCCSAAARCSGASSSKSSPWRRATLYQHYELRDYVEAGGLISYAASFPGAYRQAGAYAGRILKGAKPSELPVLQPTKFEMAINL